MSETTTITKDNYTLRTLRAGDVAPMCVILKKIGVEEFRGCFSKPEIASLIASMDGESMDDISVAVGVEVVLDIAEIIFTNYPKVEKEIFTFLASLSEMTSEQIAKLDLDVFFGMIVDVIKKEEFKGFIKVVSKSFK